VKRSLRTGALRRRWGSGDVGKKVCTAQARKEGKEGLRGKRGGRGGGVFGGGKVQKGQ